MEIVKKGPRNQFTVAFSYAQGKVILIRDDVPLWTKTVDKPNGAKVTSNGTVVVIDGSQKTEKGLGGTLSVFDSKGEILLKRQYDFNLNDCNLSDDAKICFVSTLAPDNTLYALNVEDGETIWTLKDKYASTGRIEIDQDQKLIKVTERSGLGTIRTIDFLGRPKGESEATAEKFQSLDLTKDPAEVIVGLLESSNEAVVFEALEKLKSLLGKRKIKIDSQKLLPQLRKIHGSAKENLSDLAFGNILKLYEKGLASNRDTIVFLVRSVDPKYLNEKQLFRLGRIANADAGSLESLMPVICECLKSSPEWNQKRFAAIVIGQVGKKRPDLVKDAIPTLMWYAQHPEATTEESTKLTGGGLTIRISSGVDPGTWLKDACIDTIGDIASADPSIVSDSKNLLERIASGDKSEYSRKKAQKALKSFAVVRE